jgi:uncharacterized protein YjbJ (UPF0337 family)
MKGIRRNSKMNKDQVAGKIAQALGKMEQSVGERVGNQKLANRGVVNQVKGAAKETWGDAKDAAKQIHESHKKAASEKSTQSRGKAKPVCGRSQREGQGQD